MAAWAALVLVFIPNAAPRVTLLCLCVRDTSHHVTHIHLLEESGNTWYGTHTLGLSLSHACWQIINVAVAAIVCTQMLVFWRVYLNHSIGSKHDLTDSKVPFPAPAQPR